MFHDPSTAGDWTQLVTRLDQADTLARWSDREPTLSRFPTVAALIPWQTRTARSDPPRADAALGALVRTASCHGGDDPDAALLVVHMLSGGLGSMATRLVDLDRDVLRLLVGELTAQVRAFRPDRTRLYAANLLRDTERACRRELQPHRTRTYPHGRDIPIDPLDQLATRRWLDRPVEGPGSDDDLELSDLLHWAWRQGLVSRDDVRLLVEFERRRGYGQHARHHVAARFGINERTLRRRRHRTLKVLRAAAGDYLHDSTATVRLDHATVAGRTATRLAAAS